MTSDPDLMTVLYKVPDYLKMTGKVKVTKEYVNDFIKADNTFRHQLVFCPKRRKLVPLTPYPNGSKAEELEYAGTYFNPDLGEDFAFQYAIGNVDTKSLKIIDTYSIKPKRDSLWSEDWLDYKNKVTTNSIILKKSGSKRPLAEMEDQDEGHKETNSVPLESQISDHLSHKRVKVSPKGLVDFTQLKQFSTPILSSSACTPKASVPRNRIYSRNIFKTSKVEEDIRSKYFSQDSSSKNKSLEKSPLTTKIINEPNISQSSLNSSGISTHITDSSFDETLVVTDSDRSEISETSEEEIIGFNAFTCVETSKESHSRHNSTFTAITTKKTDIRCYLSQ